MDLQVNVASLEGAGDSTSVKSNMLQIPKRPDLNMDLCIKVGTVQGSGVVTEHHKFWLSLAKKVCEFIRWEDLWILGSGEYPPKYTYRIWMGEKSHME